MREKRNTWFRLLFIIGCFIVLVGSCNKDQDDPNIVKDIDGNIYHTVTIGNQVWMVENLKTTKYRNGDLIPNVMDSVQWRSLTTGAYCNYKNNVSYVTTYGHLYNWYAVSDPRNLAPKGWHVASVAEWDVLYSFVNGECGKLKEAGTTHWYSPNKYATNETGFTALPGGARSYDGSFSGISYLGTWWTSTQYPSGGSGVYGYYDGLGYSNGGMQEGGTDCLIGYSVRCLRDN
ncbi:MAG: fibrobacter succinogenes major paralogous domain-containing protein [Bacteroidia bacterium]|nr:fibrobacter succinogenes major paralogous domain-containing protein [Bacteroidia bacterium]